MKRPLALIGLTALLVLTVCFYADFTVTAVVYAVALVGLAVSLIIKKLRKAVSPVVFFATVILAVTGFNMFTEYCVKPVQNQYGDEEHPVVATLCEELTYDDNRYYYELKAETIDGEATNVKLMLSTKQAIMCKVGDKLSFSAILNNATYGKYLSNRCYLSAYVNIEESVKVTIADERPLYYYAVELRSKIRTALYSELDYDNASLASAVLLGDKSGFSEEVSQNLRYAGLSHITVVSGLHLSIITMLYYKIIGRHLKNKYIDAAVTAIVVLLFLTLTGFGKSAIRAALMLFVLILSRLFNRESDSVNSLGLAAILLFITNPYIVGDVGVLLSFSATFGIVAFSTPLEAFLTKGLLPIEESWHKRTNKFLRKTAVLFSTTFTAALATLPVTAIFFGRVSLVQIISNMIVVPFVQYFMLAVLLVAVFHFIPYTEILTDIASFVADLIGRIILGLAKLFASIPIAYVRADYDFVFFWIFASIALLALIYALRRKGKGLHILCGVLSLAILISGCVGQIIAYSNAVTLYVIPADNGQSVILSGKDGNAVLSCSGEIYNPDYISEVLECLYSENQLMVVASEDNSASENAEDILSLFDYDMILMYDTSDSSEHAENVIASGAEIVYASEDYFVNLWDSVKLSIISHGGCVYLYLAVGSTSVLILPYMGNAEQIPEDMRSPDVLITAGMIENMELLSFDTLIVNGDSFQQAAVIDFFRYRNGEKISATETITFDIVG